MRYLPLSSLSAASDYGVSEWPSDEPVEEARCVCRETDIRRLSADDISLDAKAIRPCIEEQGWAVFVLFTGPAEGITIESPEDTWLASAFDELDELRQLPDNWDGEGSPAISGELLSTVAEALGRLKAQSVRRYPVPVVVPVAGGRVQLEWRKADRYFEIEFLNTQAARYIHKEGVNIQVGRIPVPEVSALSDLVESVCA